MNNEDITNLLETGLISTERALELLRARGEFITIHARPHEDGQSKWIIDIMGQPEHYGNSLRETLIKALAQ